MGGPGGWRASGFVLTPKRGPIPVCRHGVAPDDDMVAPERLTQIVFAWRESGGAEGALRRPKTHELSRRFLLTEIRAALQRILGPRAKGLIG